jgi:hypothetical protein
MRAVIQAAFGKAVLVFEDSIAEPSETTTTPPVVVWAPIRAGKDPRDAAEPPRNGRPGPARRCCLP